MSEKEKNMLTQDDFVLTQENSKIFDKEFDTKPTTFIKDALKRFRKNKSSVVGAYILGLLILLALVVPVLSPYDVSRISKTEMLLSPKLFNAGFGFWDGTRKYTRVVYDVDNEVPAGFLKEAVISCKVDKEVTYENQASSYGKRGYIIFVNESKDKVQTLKSANATYTSTGNYELEIDLGDETSAQDYTLGTYKISLIGLSDGNKKEVILQDFSKTNGIVKFNISEKLQSEGITELTDASIVFTLNPVSENEINPEMPNTSFSYVLIKTLSITSSEANDVIKSISFTDATKTVLVEDIKSNAYWTCTGRKGVYKSEVVYCDFVYDTYVKPYGYQSATFAMSDLKTYKKLGWCTFTEIPGDASGDTIMATFKKTNEKCPIEKITGYEINPVTKKVLNVFGEGYGYRILGYDKMPIYLMGTNESGHDMFTKAFAGLRTSLVLGVCTAAFCFLFGLCWGSISGYFGGNVDLFMERFCDILSGVPWIVVMTLCILHLGNNFFTFFLALCMTGWMGTAARTRTQFYRFKGREYVLASRTLGASDTRLIFKHILPNALGTIITGSVLMITSVIFSEATLAYLNLGLQGVQSFGVMMAENQQFLGKYPNLVIFPAIIIALMMISFNLFGNGLRDALNPSLKGSE